MHRTFRQPWMPLGVLVACCWLLGGLPAGLWGQTCSPEKRPMVVLLNSTARLRMTTGKPIKTVVNPKEGLLTIRAIERDPTTIILQGIAPGVTCLELEDADGNKECRDVIVQVDVEYLTRQIRCAVPLANIHVIPNGTNSVILTGFVHRAEDVAVALDVARNVGFANVINGLRLNGVQQVQLDVVIARVNRTKGRNFGFNFIGNARQTIYGSTVGSLIPPLPPVGVPSAQVQPSTFGQILNSAPGSANIFTGVISNAAGFIGFLQALETEGLAKLLAQPRLVTLSGNPASFLDGGEQAVPVPAGLGQVGVQFEEFGTRLNFLPIVLGNGRIHLEVEPEVSILDAASGVVISGATVPGRATQRVHTTVEMETGQTFVIGGLIQRTNVANANKVPFVGQLPFVGALFSTKTYTETETELVVLVTPHLVDAQSSCQVSKVLPGQETRRPDNFELFLEGILEAPRGPRAVFHGLRYVPAHLNGPAAKLFPCAGKTAGAQCGSDGSAECGYLPCGEMGPGCVGGTCGVAAPRDLVTPVGGSTMTNLPPAEMTPPVQPAASPAQYVPQAPQAPQAPQYVPQTGQYVPHAPQYVPPTQMPGQDTSATAGQRTYGAYSTTTPGGQPAYMTSPVAPPPPVNVPAPMPQGGQLSARTPLNLPPQPVVAAPYVHNPSAVPMAPQAGTLPQGDQP